MARILEGTLMRGFATVRDAGGADWSFKAAVEQGAVEGPRLLVSDKPLSQTGGHGDWRRRGEKQQPEIFCPTAGMRAVVCDGADAVRKPAREQLRLGQARSRSPADELEATQYQVEETRAAVGEAEAARAYVVAHAHNDGGARNCLRAGVRSIEHGNLIGGETADLVREAGAYLVPTLVTYEALSEEGRYHCAPEDVIRKIDRARKLGIEALRLAREADVKIASGSDLLGLVRRSENSILRTGNRGPTLPAAGTDGFILADLLRFAGVLD